MTGLILRLAGPLQSWGEHSTFSERDTTAFPTRSGLIGLFAAARGVRRDQSLAEYDHFELTVRIDRPGHHLTDFHTVGGGYPRSRTVLTAEGKRRTEGTTTLVSQRHYLSDAVFTVGVTGPDTVELERLADDLRRPVWAPYLGRRSCVPDQPLLLATGIPDVAEELRERTPIPSLRHDESAQRRADFIYETAPTDTAQQAPTYELNDVPLSFAPHARQYRTRRLYRRTEPVTAAQYRRGQYEMLMKYAQGAHR